MQSIIIFTYHTGVEIVQGQNRLSNTGITVSQQLVFPELFQAADYLPLAHAGTLQTTAISYLTNAKKALHSLECQKRINLVSNLLLCIVYNRGGEPFTLRWPYFKLCLIIHYGRKIKNVLT